MLRHGYLLLVVLISLRKFVEIDGSAAESKVVATREQLLTGLRSCRLRFRLHGLICVLKIIARWDSQILIVHLLGIVDLHHLSVRCAIEITRHR